MSRESPMSNQLIVKKIALPVPAILQRAGPNAMFAAEEFFKASLSNEHTRRAYGRIVRRFLVWCDRHDHELQQIPPGIAGTYIAEVVGAAMTKNQGVAALRHFFDVMVTRHAVVLNPFASVRGVKYSAVDGKTAEITVSQAKKLFKSLDTSNVVGLRDRAVIGVLAYTGARVGAVTKLRLGDYRNLGEERVLRFREKGGKEREIPVRHDLDVWLREYIEAAGLDEDSKSRAPLFRAGDRKRKVLTLAPYRPHLIRQMMK